MFNKIFNFFLKAKDDNNQCITIIKNNREDACIREIKKQPQNDRTVLIRKENNNVNNGLSIYFNGAINLFGNNQEEKILQLRLKHLSSQR